MVTGYIITYNPLDINSKVNFHHILFGRLLTRNYRHTKRVVYIKGKLHDFPFKRIQCSKIFVTSISNLNIEELKTFARIEVVETEEIFEDLTTGEEYWKRTAEKRGIEIYHGKKDKRNESSGTGSTNKSPGINEGTRIFS